MYISLAFSILTLIFGILFFYLKIKQPATIWLGITFLGFLFNLLFICVIYLVQNEMNTPLFVAALIFALVTIPMPLLMVGTFLVNGIKIIRNEGFKFANTLSLILGVGLIAYLFIWPNFVDITQSNIFNTFYQFISISTLYLSYIVIFFTVTNLLNLIHFKQTLIDYYIVLGAGLAGDQVTPLLAGRINRALTLQKAQNNGKVILSGGQGSDEAIPEGEAMMQYALDKGFNSKDLLKEVQSTSTHENIKFSKQIIDADWQGDSEPSIAIVTNNYHVLRGLLQARSLGVKSIGYGSRTKFYFSLNAFLREFVAYLQLTYKVHIAIIGLIGIGLFGIFLILEFYI